MVSCREVIAQLWDYLDGELPLQRMEEIAGHLAECGRCNPQYRFEFAFLELVARQAARGEAPSRQLVERVRQLVIS